MSELVASRHVEPNTFSLAPRSPAEPLLVYAEVEAEPANICARYGHVDAGYSITYAEFTTGYAILGSTIGVRRDAEITATFRCASPQAFIDARLSSFYLYSISSQY